MAPKRSIPSENCLQERESPRGGRGHPADRQQRAAVFFVTGLAAALVVLIGAVLCFGIGRPPLARTAPPVTPSAVRSAP
jgi:hypothetical protein